MADDVATATGAQVPVVDYLVLDEHPHLVAWECDSCGARFFDRRNACASCFATSFHRADVATEGEVRAFTIVSLAAPGVPVPFVSATIDCGGTSVRANVVNCDPTPEAVTLGMKVRLTTFPIGTDSAGTEAVGFGFEPIA
ncbi:MAG TPA: OB-fold domain-containing protein [Acidimicrobiales bacterium]|nr:OB-fold domain-containing protein [Acidimicrobiales bacterium]